MIEPSLYVHLLAFTFLTSESGNQSKPIQFSVPTGVFNAQQARN
jgi:hypothetical protein